MQPRLLILETSHRLGRVAVAVGETIVGERGLDESRRHARDLAPAVKELLSEQGWHASELAGVIVSRGPGSYTGLRVGVMSAKTLAYATGCALLAIDTFEAIALQVPLTPAPLPHGGEENTAECYVIADAQQDKIYVQRFGQHPEPLAIVPLDAWLTRVEPGGAIVTGPGLEAFALRLPSWVQVLPRETWLPRCASLLRLGLARFEAGQRDDPFAVEPIYLRPSSAEEKWTTLKPRDERSDSRG